VHESGRNRKSGRKFIWGKPTRQLIGRKTRRLIGFCAKCGVTLARSFQCPNAMCGRKAPTGASERLKDRMDLRRALIHRQNHCGPMSRYQAIGKQIERVETEIAALRG